MTSKTHTSLRNDDHFKHFWTIIGIMDEEKGIDELTLPRRCKDPTFES